MDYLVSSLSSLHIAFFFLMGTCEELIVKDLCPSNNFQNLNQIYKEDIWTSRQTDFLMY